MKVVFASDIIKITFQENEPFANGSVTMEGEVLNKGFATLVDTMTWLSPNKGEPVSSTDKTLICTMVSEYNANKDFNIELVEE